MSVSIGEVIKEVILDFDRDKVQFHRIELTGLEASLTAWSSGDFIVELKLKDHGTLELGSWNNKTQAEAEYDRIVGKIQKGEYQLRAYSNGRLEIDFC